MPQAALPYLRPPGERVEIPYQGKTLAGILRKPAGVERPPVLVFAVGLDSTKEETDAYESRSSRAAWRRSPSTGRARARRNTTSPSAAITRCR